VVQRVSRAEVRVAGEVVGRIEQGMLVLLGVLAGDGLEQAHALADKLAGFRFFPDDEGRMNLDLGQVGGGALVVSQFTLAADGRKGRRPSFDRAADPSEAAPLYEAFCERLAEHGLGVETGRFGAAMEVELVNDGPVTFVLEQPPA
jgi:D-tyrosyl-tRNA(Tyr) deacylase